MDRRCKKRRCPDEEDKANLPNPEQIRTAIFSQYPILLRKTSDWDIISWKPLRWSQLLSDSRPVPFRKGIASCGKEPQWESDCTTVEMSFNDFFQKFFDRNSNEWYYFDYKYMPEWFNEGVATEMNLTWSRVGFPDRTWKDSTFWMGTQGAHTPCHIDTYGCNFVTQVYGTKLWLLFPPGETSNLKPTRIPYEESSVFSLWNFFCPEQFPKVNDVRTVVLNPGDILFIPKGWWHYVENLSSAISINTWIPLESDNVSRVQESLVKSFFTAQLKQVPNTSQILNPNEKDLTQFTVSESLKELEWCVQNASCSESTGTVDECLVPYEIENMSDAMSNLKSYKPSHNCVETNPRSGADPMITNYINAFCDPEVIRLVYSKLMQRISCTK